MSESHEKKNTAERIDGSIDKLDNSIKAKFDSLSHKLAVILAGIAKTYGIPSTGLKIGMGIAVLGGGWLLVSTYVHGRSGYYASEMGGMFVSIAFGIVLIFIASACHKAAKLLDNPALARKAAPKHTTAKADTTTTSHHAATASHTKPTVGARIKADVSWLVYGVSASLMLFFIFKPASSRLAWELKESQQIILLAWLWVIGTTIYAWYRYRGGKWTLSLGGFPLTFLIFLINIGLILLLLVQYP